MFSGFDFGTSNCALGVLNVQNTVQLLNIDGEHCFMPSNLYAYERELIPEFVGANIHNPNERKDFLELRRNALQLARNIRNEQGFSSDESCVFVGREAFEHYIDLPSEGYYIKSPKSFLGASGLRPEFLGFFEDIVTAMMQTVKGRAEQALGASIEQTVIGRPVNFQGLNADASNQQALSILTTSARRAGFKDVEFLYEPLAAAMDFEAALEDNKTVLVVDIGGGTSDCAMVRMGPEHRQKQDRSEDFLSHTGERVGGNDLDIQLAGLELMPLLGSKSLLKNGQSLPHHNHWNAVKINDVNAQSLFASLQTQHSIKQLLIDTTEPEKLRRLLKLQEHKLNHHLVRSAEQCKIDLSSTANNSVSLGYLEEQLSTDISQSEFAQAIEAPLQKILRLMTQAISDAGCQPELIYITGGSAKSPVLRNRIQQQIGDIAVVDGDHFGSVAAGLTLWAERLYS